MKTNILLTGATGNVGGKLVPAILRHMPDAAITLLVRGQSQAHAYERAMRTIRKLTPDFDEGDARGRVQVICGDIIRPKLGLGSNEYMTLASDCTHIIHSAAATKFRMPASEARATNYDGTRNMVHFGRRAMRLGGLHRFAYISTAYACGNRSGRIPEIMYETKPQFTNIYEQTKWEAERYLYRFRDDLPLDIFRPSIIVGDSRTGIINDFNVLYVPLRLILTGHIQMLPCRPDIPLDVVPLDYVADIINNIVFHSNGRSTGIFHVVAGFGNEVTVGDIVSGAVNRAKQRFPTLPVGRVRYLSGIKAGPRLTRFIVSGNRTMSILGEYIPYFITERHFDNANMHSMLPHPITLPGFETYIENLMQYFIDEDLGRRLRPAA